MNKKAYFSCYFTYFDADSLDSSFFVSNFVIPYYVHHFFDAKK